MKRKILIMIIISITVCMFSYEDFSVEAYFDNEHNIVFQIFDLDRNFYLETDESGNIDDDPEIDGYTFKAYYTTFVGTYVNQTEFTPYNWVCSFNGNIVLNEKINWQSPVFKIPYVSGIEEAGCGVLHVSIEFHYSSSTSSGYVTLFKDVSVNPISNRISTKVINVPEKNETEICSLSTGEISEKIIYADPDGKIRQIISKNASDSFKDIVEHKIYDELGREYKQLLPFASDTGDGRFRRNAETSLLNFYGVNNPGGNPYDTSPFAVKKYFKCPEDVVYEQGGIGSVFQPAADNTNGHTTKTFSATNKADTPGGEVRIWGEDGHPTSSYYSHDKLTIQIVTDPNGLTSYSFTDMNGKIVLKRSAIDDAGNQFKETYYVFDDKGNQVAIIPPELANSYQYELGETDQNNIDLVNKYATIMKYDTRNRLIEKTLPECGTIETVYDKTGRIVLTRDSNMRAQDHWTFSKVDVRGRTILSGIYEGPAIHTRSFLQNMFDDPAFSSSFDLYEKRDPSEAFEYSNAAFPNIINCQVLSVNYYDNYDFPGNENYTFAPCSELPEVEKFDRVSGKATCSKVRVLNSDTPGGTIFYGNHSYSYCPDEVVVKYSGESIIFNPGFCTHPGQQLEASSSIDILTNGPENQWLETVTYYDKHGNVIQTQSLDHMNMKTINTVSYNFIDLPVKEVTVKEIVSGSLDYNTLVTRKRYEYNHNDGIKQVYMQVNDDDPILVLENHYNEMNQLKSKLLDARLDENFDLFSSDPVSLTDAAFLQKVDYWYNIKGKVTQVNDVDFRSNDNDMFAYKLNFENTETGYTTPNYTGIISEFIWRTRSSSSFGNSQKMAYAYAYDNSYQLESAKFGVNNDTDQNPYPYENFGTYDVDNIQYDLNGNIKHIDRKGTGANGYIDQLSYNYDGNKLIAVDDAVSTLQSEDFNDRGHNYSTSGQIEYVYDANGNLTEDHNKGINISYNYLNLPDFVSFEDGRSIEWIYSAGGAKLRKNVRDADGNITSTTDYCGGVILDNRIIKQVTQPAGRIVMNADHNFEYVYDMKDHLSNTRASVKRDTDMSSPSFYDPLLVQEDHYYPFGMRLGGLSSANGDKSNKFLYNNKEYEDDYNLNWYHYGVRYYDPQLGRWMAVDPVDEFFSPYVYCHNDPVNFLDPDGAVAKAYSITISGGLFVGGSLSWGHMSTDTECRDTFAKGKSMGNTFGLSISIESTVYSNDDLSVYSGETTTITDGYFVNNHRHVIRSESGDVMATGEGTSISFDLLPIGKIKWLKKFANLKKIGSHEVSVSNTKDSKIYTHQEYFEQDMIGQEIIKIGAPIDNLNRKLQVEQLNRSNAPDEAYPPSSRQTTESGESDEWD